MIVRIILKKGLLVLKEHLPGAEHLNTGDILMLNGEGWEYKVLNKVMHQTDSKQYLIDVLVKKL